jgi:hypothetical protein
MPIRPENRNRHPVNWHNEIRPLILKRANNCCEGSPALNRDRTLSPFSRQFEHGRQYL